MGDYTQYISVVVILGLLVLFGGLYLFILDRRFPNVKFRIYEGNRTYQLTQRVIGDKIIDGGLIAILINGNKLIGEDLKTFDYVYEENRFGAPSKVYLATYRNKILVPIKKSEMTLEISPLASAREIAIRYVNLIDNVEKQLDKSNPIINALISAVPNSLPVLFGGIIMYLILTSVGANMERIVNILNEIVIKLDNIEHQKPLATNLTEYWVNPNNMNVTGG